LRAVVLDRPGELRIAERPSPEPAAGEALVRIRTTGICGTDVKIFDGNIPVVYPVVLGHEMVGTLETPAGELAPGARVIVDPNLVCGVCYQCSRGQANVCAKAQLMGRDRDGSLCELVSAPVQNIHALPDSIDDRVAPLIQVMTTCLHAQRLTPIFPRASVLILGLGVAGLLQVQLAKARGADPLIGITRSGSKRAVAEQLGADLTLDPSDPQLANKIRDATGGRGPDVVIECVGKLETFTRSIELARVGGHLTLFGIISATEGALPFYQMYFKELSMSNPRAAKAEDYPDAIGLVESGAVTLEPLMTRTFSLTSAQEAIEETARAGTLKVMVDHGDGS
jgi:2-desacetyl-2-hydroxyethyl bacteriochlorophyllide A dehydrogenase